MALTALNATDTPGRELTVSDVRAGALTQESVIDGKVIDLNVVLRYFDKIVRRRLTTQQKGLLDSGGYITVERGAAAFDGSVVALKARNMHGNEGNRGRVITGLMRVSCFIDTLRPDLDTGRRGYVWPETIHREFPGINNEHGNSPVGYYLPYEDVLCNDLDLRLPDISPEFPVDAITAFLGAEAMEHPASVTLRCNIDGLAAREHAVRTQSDL